MIKQAFQHAELRDANDNIIQQGAYGKKSDLANATNDAWIDFVMNNLEVLYDEKASTEYIVNLIDEKCAQAKAEALLAAHPVGSFYESNNPTSPETLFGGTWEEKIPDGELVGAVMAYPGNGTAPDGWTLCDGSAINRAIYSALFTVIGTTYGTGDGSSTFNLPDLSDKFIQGDAMAGTTKVAGLPNITGSFANRPLNNQSQPTVYAFSGVFTRTTGAVSNIGISTTSVGTEGYTAQFDASRSSSIYGASTTVQPPAVTMRYLIYTGVTSKRKWLRTA